MTATRGAGVVGAGQVAAVAARTLRRRGFDGPIDLIGAEPHAPYQRPPLSKEYLADGARDDLFLLGEQWRAKNEVSLHLGVPAIQIRPQDRTVELADGSSMPADVVLIATGGRARRLPGVEGHRIHYLRTLDDADRLLGPAMELANEAQMEMFMYAQQLADQRRADTTTQVVPGGIDQRSE